MTQGAPPGWYPDPQQPASLGQQRWWDGEQWTQHTQGAAQAAPPVLGPPATATAAGDSKQWAMAAHLSAIVSAFFVVAFIGPLIVYLVKKDEDPFVRRHAAEALNFNLSALIYAVVGGIVLVILVVLIIGIVLIPVAMAAVVAWLVLVILAGVKAGKGEDYRYPLTIRFVD